MPTYAKSIVAAVTTLLAQLVLVMSGDETIGDLTQVEWIVVVLNTIVATAAVWGIPNGASRNPRLSTPGPFPGEVAAEGGDVGGVRRITVHRNLDDPIIEAQVAAEAARRAREGER
jgi:hypothetical protein